MLEQVDLYILDDIIVSKLNPVNFSGADSTETILELVEAAKLSAEFNKKCLISEAFDIKNGNTTEQVIHNYQERFIYLSNFLHESLKKANTFSKHLKKLDKIIDELLQFIQTYFPKRFDNNFEVPTKTKLSKIAEYKKLVVTQQE